MTGRSVEMHRLEELVRLHRLKTSAREVCRLLGMGRTTEWHYRQALAKAGLLVGDPADLPPLEVIKAATTRSAAQAVAQQDQGGGDTECSAEQANEHSPCTVAPRSRDRSPEPDRRFQGMGRPLTRTKA